MAFREFGPVKRWVVPWLKQASTFLILARGFGQFRTIRSAETTDANGACIPWYTYPAIEYLSLFDFSEISVLEYGSGNSSNWWAMRCKQLISIESDSAWFEKIRRANARFQNFDYRFDAGPETYCDQPEIATVGIIVIDAGWRFECAKAVVSQRAKVQQNCYAIILDNSERYPEILELLTDGLGWTQCDFLGFGPINRYCWATSVFLNPKKPLKRIRNISPIGGIVSADNTPSRSKTC
jgi:hypothetical protein